MINKEISIVWTEEKLNEILTMPSKQLVEDIKKIDGDIMVLGAGGKMGPTLCVLAKKACQEAGIDKRIIAVSRFSDKKARAELDYNPMSVEKSIKDMADWIKEYEAKK